MAWLRPGAASHAAAGPLFQPEGFAAVPGAPGAPEALGAPAASSDSPLRPLLQQRRKNRTNGLAYAGAATLVLLAALLLCRGFSAAPQQQRGPAVGPPTDPRPLSPFGARRTLGAPEGPLGAAEGPPETLEGKTRPQKRRRSEFVQLGSVRKRRLLSFYEGSAAAELLVALTRAFTDSSRAAAAAGRSLLTGEAAAAAAAAAAEGGSLTVDVHPQHSHDFLLWAKALGLPHGGKRQQRPWTIAHMPSSRHSSSSSSSSSSSKEKAPDGSAAKDPSRAPQNTAGEKATGAPTGAPGGAPVGPPVGAPLGAPRDIMGGLINRLQRAAVSREEDFLRDLGLWLVEARKEENAEKCETLNPKP
ncbi:hypothetical protein, conserved [Eimeria tenella]|uniref:Transmembrane protein n=1 Tax=Eimeria tenella TaxID=5802 RepID=U6KQY7_EIMTE|nr:hypothetical protein, conserved [Eimeria tenella]CDJ38789.1 hypothetical protein, conserved [Eimeria tenella]|eukprot:XP_013229545.1 hypothetical protein, conserved [Eimeria tenella]